MAMSWETWLPNPTGLTQETVTVTEHWYLTEDRCRVVREGDPAGRWLWASPGTQVSRQDALRLGALSEEPEPEGAVAEESESAAEPAADDAAEDEAPADEKKAKQAPNKAAKKAPNKAAGKAEDK